MLFVCAVSGDAAIDLRRLLMAICVPHALWWSLGIPQPIPRLSTNKYIFNVSFLNCRYVQRMALFQIDGCAANCQAAVGAF